MIDEADDPELDQLIEERLASEAFRKYLACNGQHRWGPTVNDSVLGWSHECQVCGCWEFASPS